MENELYATYRMVQIPMTLSEHNLYFMVMILFDV